jgi:membrane peptidoglycan carboxypeptidase
MALRYVVRLAKRMGVDSSLDPVLSLPLGANAVTMEDVSRMYYALVTGSIVQPENQPEERSWSFLIQRIEGPDGEVLYEARPQVKRVIDPHLAQSSAEILRKVISNGTGHQADNALILSGSRHEAILKKLNLKVPALGKTGTADEYRNSSFVGFLPGAHPGSSSLTLDNGVVIAVYVGYDDNRPMKNTHVRVYGAAGALPIWIPVAQSALRHLNLEERLDILDFTFRPGGALAIEWSPEMREVPVDSGSGLPQAGGAGVRVRTYGDMVGERFEPRRLFSPAILSEKGK